MHLLRGLFASHSNIKQVSCFERSILANLHLNKKEKKNNIFSRVLELFVLLLLDHMINTPKKFVLVELMVHDEVSKVQDLNKRRELETRTRGSIKNGNVARTKMDERQCLMSQEIKCMQTTLTAKYSQEKDKGTVSEPLELLT